DYWYSKNIQIKLALIKYIIFNIKNNDIKNFVLLTFLDTARTFSYTRNNEFKLYRIKIDDILDFDEDVYSYFINRLSNNIEFYKNYYYKYFKNKINALFYNEAFYKKNKYFDVVLTSPPYGDSRTTVAYGQFSFFANIWLGNDEARKIDNMLMGGKNKKQLLNDSIIAEQIYNIDKIDSKRAFEVSSFYIDLRDSIKAVSSSINDGGYAVYIVGNRIVKNEYLNTDKFIAESFERENFKHLFTYRRNIKNKRMPLKNSPTNKKGLLSNTMTEEFIVVLRKT
ncbi:adenine methyltransferase, partial [uncultured Brachyspira sp.]